MFRGTINVTTDLNTVQNMMGSHRIVFIGEPNAELVQATNGIVGSIFLPPYQAMMALSDNDLNTFNGIYSQHLMSNECSSILSVLIKGMINGINLLIYMTPDEYNMYFIGFKSFVRQNYGITIGSMYEPFGYDNQYDYVIYSLLYLNELITIQEFFTVYPQGINFTDPVVMKLINEMRPPVQDTSFESYRAYFFNYKESVKQTNSYLPNLFSRSL